jgi:hypothetical protein
MLDWLFPGRRRAKLRATPLDDARRAILARNFPYWTRLSPDDRRELEGHVQVFLAEKSFEGCGGLVLTDEMKVTVAAQACLLLLRRVASDAPCYPGLDVILVYPKAFRAPEAQREGAVVIEGGSGRLGESHQRGIVVVSWDDVRRGAADPNDGRNVVFHEFAHQLDQADGAADGAPELDRPSMYGPWAATLGAEFEGLVEDAERRRKTVLDKYGASHPAEFFAVATEAFFEKPRQLKAKHPELYEQLAAFYRQDPIERA